MASRITKIHLAALDILKSIKLDKRSKGYFRYINIWNKQIRDMLSGKGYSFDLPACFIEFIPGECKMLGMKMSSYPGTIVKFHIVNLLLNDGDNMERNLIIFDIRDDVKTAFLTNGLPFCSTLMCSEDVLEYDHGDGVYEYEISFLTNFIDSKGSIFDEDSGAEIGSIQNPNVIVRQPAKSYVDNKKSNYSKNGKIYSYGKYKR